MKTTPRDYTFKYEGTNPLEKLRPSEPWFFIRAQDKLGPEAVSAYADLLKREADKAFADGDEDKSNELFKRALGVQRVASVFLDWQFANKEFVKLPD